MRRELFTALAGLVIFLGTIAFVRLPAAHAGRQMLAGGCTVGVGNILCDNASDSVTTTLDLFGVVSLAGGDDTLTVGTGRVVGDSSTSSTDGVIGGTGADSIINNGTVRGQVAIAENSSLTADINIDTIINNGIVQSSQVAVALGAGDSLSNTSIITSAQTAVNCVTASAGCAISNSGTITGAILGQVGNDTVVNSAGLINGTVSLSTGNNSIVINGGTLDGRILTGSGHDTLINHGSITGTEFFSLAGGNNVVTNGSLGNINVELTLVSGSDSVTNNGTLFGINLGEGSNSFVNQGVNTTSVAYTGFVRSAGSNVVNSVSNDGRIGTLQFGGFSSTTGNLIVNTGTIDNFVIASSGTLMNMGTGSIGSSVNLSAAIRPESLSNLGTISGNVSGGGGNGDMYNGLNLNSINAVITGGMFGEGGNDTLRNLARGTVGGIDGGTGDDSISNASLVSGVMVGGDGNDTVSNLAGGLANFVSGDGGNDSVSNLGAVNTSLQGGIGNDTVTNFAGAVASWLEGFDGDDRVLNGGFVNADLMGGAGNDSIVNFGGAFVSQMYGDAGNDTVINGGFLLGSARGGTDNDIVVNLGGAQATSLLGEAGNDSVFNGGYLVGQIFGDAGNDTVVNAAFSYSAGAVLGDGDDQFVNGGFLNGSVDCGAGNDTVSVGGFIAGGIVCGAGNDLVYIFDGVVLGAGGVIAGTINGGTDTDGLGFAFNVFVSSQAEANAISAALAAASPLGGSITIAGVPYTWLNFEVLYDLLVFSINEPVTIIIPVTRRVNQADAAAPVAVYCAADAVELWTVGADGAGSHAFSVSAADVMAGTVVSAQGVTFSAPGDGSFSVSATASDGKPYAFTGSCE